MIRGMLLVSIFLSGAIGARAQSFGYAFEGQWDCGAGVVTFSDQTYFNGADTLTMTDVEQSGESYVLRFADGSEIALVEVTDTSMEWLAPSGATQTCARVQ